MNTTDQIWCRASAERVISSDQVHVWRASLDLDFFQIEELMQTLSADEIERADRFHFEKDKNRFIAARGILRRILGSYIGIIPRKIRFEYTRHGKPLLVTNIYPDVLCFNLSHSGEFALYAFTLQRHIGVDIEYNRSDISIEEIAKRFFSGNEIISLNKTPKDKQHEVFFQYWTRKEAFLKAKGKGIYFPIETVDVSLINGRGFSPVTFHGYERESKSWYVQDLFPGHGYVAAIAVEGGHCDLSCLHYAI